MIKWCDINDMLQLIISLKNPWSKATVMPMCPKAPMWLWGFLQPGERSLPALATNNAVLLAGDLLQYPLFIYILAGCAGGAAILVVVVSSVICCCMKRKHKFIPVPSGEWGALLPLGWSCQRIVYVRAGAEIAPAWTGLTLVVSHLPSSSPLTQQSRNLLTDRQLLGVVGSWRKLCFSSF